MTSTECTILAWTRRIALWAFLVSASLVLLLQLLETWDLLETTDQSLFGYGDPNAWGRIENTAMVIMTIALFVLLTLLIAKYAKKDDGAKETAGASPKKSGASTAKAASASSKVEK